MVEDVQAGSAAATIARLQRERSETLRLLLRVADSDCGQQVQWAGRPQTVNQRLRAFTGHADDHFQHIHRLLQARHRPISEAQLLLMKANAALAEFEALVLSLDDAEFDAVGPNEGDWSARKIVEHVLNNERQYREAIVEGLAAAGRDPRGQSTRA